MLKSIEWEVQIIKVLIVDEDSLSRFLIASVLHETGMYEVIQADNGEEALAHFIGDGHFQLIISDFNMPRMDGMDLLRNIRAEDASVPFLMISGNCEKEFAAVTKTNGATEFIPKDKLSDEVILSLAGRYVKSPA